MSQLSKDPEALRVPALVGLWPGGDTDDVESSVEAASYDGGVPTQGVSVLLGTNGAGKTTLLRRMRLTLQPADASLGHSNNWTVLTMRDPDAAARIRAAAQLHGVVEHSRLEEILSEYVEGTDEYDIWLFDSGELNIAEPGSGPLDDGTPGGRQAVLRALGVPDVILVGALDHDPDAAAVEAVADALAFSSYLRGDQLWNDDALGPLRNEVIALLNSMLSPTAPSFLTARGLLRVEQSRDDPEVPLRVVNVSGGRTRPLAAAGLGLRRWAAIVIRVLAPLLRTHVHVRTLNLPEELLDRFHDPRLLASLSTTFDPRRMRDELDDEKSRLRVTSAAGSARPLLLLDEPEAHLHEAALLDVADWLTEFARANTGAVIATHAPQLLQPRPDWRMLEVTPAVWGAEHDPGTPARVSDITGQLLDRLVTSADGLGFSSSTWVMALAGLVAVEGDQDVAVLHHWLGQRLHQARLKVVKLNGFTKWKQVATSQVAVAMGWQQYYWFDEVSRAVLDGHRRDGTLPRSDEGKAMIELLRLRDEGHPVHAVPFDQPDIMCAIRPAVLARVRPQVKKRLREFTGLDTWDDAVAQWREMSEEAERPANFKTWALSEILQLGKQPWNVIDDMVAALDRDDLPTPAFVAAADALFDLVGGHADP